MVMRIELLSGTRLCSVFAQIQHHVLIPDKDFSHMFHMAFEKLNEV